MGYRTTMFISQKTSTKYRRPLEKSWRKIRKLWVIMDRCMGELVSGFFSREWVSTVFNGQSPADLLWFFVCYPQVYPQTLTCFNLSILMQILKLCFGWKMKKINAEQKEFWRFRNCRLSFSINQSINPRLCPAGLLRHSVFPDDFSRKGWRAVRWKYVLYIKP